MIRYIISLFIVFLALNVKAQRPLMQDQQLINEINQTLDLIYNFEFSEATHSIEDIRRKIGEHPGLFFLEAMIIYWRDRPLEVDSDIYHTYENKLNNTIEFAEPFVNDDDLKMEGVFYKLCGYGFLADLYSEEGGNMKVIGNARSAYKYLKKGFEMMDDFPDFYFTTGLYNYYRVKYPELHPFYKSFLWLFTNGDKDLGIAYLKEASLTGIFTSREASIYLFHLYQRYENQPKDAYISINHLVNQFPQNVRFKCYYLETLFALDSIQSAHSIINQFPKSDEVFFKLSLSLFRAMYDERTGKMDSAMVKYKQALSISLSMKNKYDHYESMVYAGMARVSDNQRDTEKAKYYYREALNLDPYIPVRDEALNYINAHED